MPRKFKEARQINKLKVIEAAAKLGVSQPTLSAWEGERKSPGLDNLENMADLYGVSTDYLLGRSEQGGGDPSVPITAKSLPVFHGKPVWSAGHGWMLVNAIDKVLLLPDGRTIPFADCVQLFASAQLFSEPALLDCSPLPLSDVKKREQIWLEPISPDSELRNELRGWYRVQARFVQNEYGNRFYLDTYGAKWLAFDKED